MSHMPSFYICSYEKGVEILDALMNNLINRLERRVRNGLPIELGGNRIRKENFGNDAHFFFLFFKQVF